MGILHLLKEFAPASRSTHLSEFQGKCLAIDAMCWMHRAAFCCAIELAQEAEAIATNQTPPPHPHRYLLWLRRMTRMLIHFEITPIFVFDGGALPAKANVNNARDSSRLTWRQRALALQAEGRMAEAADAAGKCISVTPTMLRNFQHLLRQEGVRFIIAPYEADAQIGYLYQRGDIHAAITEDSDLLPFGCRRILIKLDREGNCQRIDLDTVIADTWSAKHYPYLNKIKKILQGSITPSEAAAAAAASASIAADSSATTVPPARNHVNFLYACVLSGCDYLVSLRGIGLRTALTLVDDYPRIDDLLFYLKRDRKKLEDKWKKERDKAKLKKQEDAEANGAAAIDEDSDSSQPMMTTAEYIELYWRAVLVFQHQLVFDPDTHEFKHLTPLPPQLQRIFDRTMAASKSKDGPVMNVDEDNASSTAAAASSAASTPGALPPSHPLLRCDNFNFLGPPIPSELTVAFVAGRIDPKTLRPYPEGFRLTDLREIEAGGQRAKGQPTQQRQQRAQSYGPGRRMPATPLPTAAAASSTISTFFQRAVSTPTQFRSVMQPPLPSRKLPVAISPAALAAQRANDQNEFDDLFGSADIMQEPPTTNEFKTEETQPLCDDLDVEEDFADPPPLDDSCEEEAAPYNPFATARQHQQLGSVDSHPLTFADSVDNSNSASSAALSASAPSHSTTKPSVASSVLASLLSSASSAAFAVVTAPSSTPAKRRPSKDFLAGVSPTLLQRSPTAPVFSASTSPAPVACASNHSCIDIDLTDEVDEDERKDSTISRSPFTELVKNSSNPASASATKRKSSSVSAIKSGSSNKKTKKGSNSIADVGKSASLLSFGFAKH